MVPAGLGHEQVARRAVGELRRGDPQHAGPVLAEPARRSRRVEPESQTSSSTSRSTSWPRTASSVRANPGPASSVGIATVTGAGIGLCSRSRADRADRSGRTCFSLRSHGGGRQDRIDSGRVAALAGAGGPASAARSYVAIVGLCWALLVPPWQSPDELAHFAYAQSLAESFRRFRGPRAGTSPRRIR